MTVVRRWWPLLLHLGLDVAYFAASRAVVASGKYSSIATHGFPYTRKYLEGYARWDAAWYVQIVQHGYDYLGRGHQASVAFFPVFPLAIKATTFVVHDAIGDGVAVSLVCGLAATALFVLWLRRRDTPAPAVGSALLVLLLNPYAYYLFGVIYSDAMFLVVAIGSFLLLESGHRWLAAVGGAVAAATRPVGLAVGLGLLIAAMEADGVLALNWHRPLRVHLDLRRIRVRTLAPLASVLGLAAYCFYLWRSYDRPFAFADAATAPGWSKRFGPRTFIKIEYLRLVHRGPMTMQTITLTASAAACLLAFASIVAVGRRLGTGYAVYVFAAVGIAFATSPEFFGIGRYVLAAFPCFAAGGAMLAERSQSVRRSVFAVAGISLAWFAVMFIRGFYLA